jgi:hypothetical protein
MIVVVVVVVVQVVEVLVVLILAVKVEIVDIAIVMRFITIILDVYFVNLLIVHSSNGNSKSNVNAKIIFINDHLFNSNFHTYISM